MENKIRADSFKSCFKSIEVANSENTDNITSCDLSPVDSPVDSPSSYKKDAPSPASPYKKDSASPYKEDSPYKDCKYKGERSSKISTCLQGMTRSRLQNQMAIGKRISSIIMSRFKKQKQPRIKKSEIGDYQMQKIEGKGQFQDLWFGQKNKAKSMTVAMPILHSRISISNQSLSNKEELENLDRWHQEQQRIIANKLPEKQLKKHLNQLQFALNVNKPLSKIKIKERRSLNFQETHKKIKQQFILPSSSSALPTLPSSVTVTVKQSLNSSPPVIEQDNSLIKNASPGIISQFSVEQYKNLRIMSQFAPIHLSQFKQRVDQKYIRRMNIKNKISEIEEFYKQRYQKIKSTKFMTEDRIQALYECEMIKEVRGILKPKDYYNLCFMKVSAPDPSQTKIKKQVSVKTIVLRSKKEITEDENRFEEMHEIIDRNKKRLRKEKQKIMEKINI